MHRDVMREVNKRAKETNTFRPSAHQSTGVNGRVKMLLFFPCTIQRLMMVLLLSAAALLLVDGVEADGEAGNEEANGQVVLVNLPLQIEDVILRAVAAAGLEDGSGDISDEVAGERQQNNSPARGEASSVSGKLTPDNSGEDIGYMGAGLLGAAIGAGLGAAWGGAAGSYGGANYYQQGYNPGIYGAGNPYGSYPYVGYPLATAGYRPPRPDSFYPPPGPAYGDQQQSDYLFQHAADVKAADADGGLAGFQGISYPGYYSEPLSAGNASPEKVTTSVGSTTATIGSSSTGQKKQPSSSSSTASTTGGGGSHSGYPIDWSAVAEAYYGSRKVLHPSSVSSYSRSGAIIVSDSHPLYPLLFDDY